MRASIFALAVVAAGALAFGCGDDASSDESAEPDAGASSPTEDAGEPAAPVTGGARGTAAPFECGDDGSDWDAAWQARECEVIDLVNGHRAQGADCGSEGSFAATGAVEPHAVLTANARAHSKDMIANDYFAQEDLAGRSPFEWGLEGYAENVGARVDVASGQRTAAELVDGLMASPVNCSNLMSPSSHYIGVGYADDGARDADAGAVGATRWTIVSAD